MQDPSKFLGYAKRFIRSCGGRTWDTLGGCGDPIYNGSRIFRGTIRYMEYKLRFTENPQGTSWHFECWNSVVSDWLQDHPTTRRDDNTPIVCGVAYETGTETPFSEYELKEGPSVIEISRA